MKLLVLLATSVAIMLAACNKDGDEAQTNAAPAEGVTITQAAPPPGGTWADVVNATPAGFVMGDPNAKVKLIEIGSLSCPHCRKFDEEGVPKLIESYVKSGKVSWEFRPFLIHGPIDVAANLVVRCNGAKTFFPLVRALYKDQPTWMAKVEAAPQEKLAEIQNLPPNRAFIEMGSVMGLQNWAASRGIPHAKSDQCLSDQARIDQEVQISGDVTNQFPEFSGTPAFVLDGKLMNDVSGWETLKPKLDAAIG